MPETAATDAEEQIHGLGIIGGLVAVSAWGLSGVIAKHIEMGGIAIGAYRFTTYGLVVGVAMTARGTRISRRVLRGSMWGGIALGLDVAFFFSAIKHTSIANATVIGALQPVVVGIFSWRLFGEQIRRRDVTLGLVALLGVFVVVLSADSAAGPSLDGDLLAVGALFAWAAYFVFSKRAKGVLTSNEYTVGAALWVGVINFPLAAAFGQSLAWPTAESWVWLLALTFGAGVFGHAMMNWSIQQIPLWLGSTLTLLIPVVSAVAAWVFLDEPLTLMQVLAMAVVLAALAGVITGQSGIGSRPRPLRR